MREVRAKLAFSLPQHLVGVIWLVSLGFMIWAALAAAPDDVLYLALGAFIGCSAAWVALQLSQPNRAPWYVLLGAGLLLFAVGVTGIAWHPNNMVTVGGFVFAYLGFGFLVALFRPAGSPRTRTRPRTRPATPPARVPRRSSRPCRLRRRAIFPPTYRATTAAAGQSGHFKEGSWKLCAMWKENTPHACEISVYCKVSALGSPGARRHGSQTGHGRRFRVALRSGSPLATVPGRA